MLKISVGPSGLRLGSVISSKHINGSSLDLRWFWQKSTQQNFTQRILARDRKWILYVALMFFSNLLMAQVASEGYSIECRKKKDKVSIQSLFEKDACSVKREVSGKKTEVILSAEKNSAKCLEKERTLVDELTKRGFRCD